MLCLVRFPFHHPLWGNTVTVTLFGLASNFLMLMNNSYLTSVLFCQSCKWSRFNSGTGHICEQACQQGCTHNVMWWQILTKKQAEEPLDFLKIQTKIAWVKSTEKLKSSVTLPLFATFKTSEKIKSWIQSHKHLVS